MPGRVARGMTARTYLVVVIASVCTFVCGDALRIGNGVLGHLNVGHSAQITLQRTDHSLNQAAHIRQLQIEAVSRARVGTLHSVYANMSLDNSFAAAALADVIDLVLLRLGSFSSDVSQHSTLPLTAILQDEVQRTAQLLEVQSKKGILDRMKLESECRALNASHARRQRDIQTQLHALQNAPGNSSEVDRLQELRNLAQQVDEAKHKYHRRIVSGLGTAVEALQQRHADAVIHSKRTLHDSNAKPDDALSNHLDLLEDPLGELLARHVMLASYTTQQPPNTAGLNTATKFADSDTDVALISQLERASKLDSVRHMQDLESCTFRLNSIGNTSTRLQQRHDMLDIVEIALSGNASSVNTAGSFFSHVPGQQDSRVYVRQAVALAYVAEALRSNFSFGRLPNASSYRLRDTYQSVVARFDVGDFRFRQQAASSSGSAFPGVVVAVGAGRSAVAKNAPSSIIDGLDVVANGVPLIHPQPIPKPAENLDAAATSRYLKADVPTGPPRPPRAPDASGRPTKKVRPDVLDNAPRPHDTDKFTAAKLRYIPVPRACDVAGQPCYIDPDRTPPVDAFGRAQRRGSIDNSGLNMIDIRANCSWHGALQIRAPGLAPPTSHERLSGGDHPIVFETVEDALLVASTVTPSMVAQTCVCDAGYTGARCAYCAAGYHKIVVSAADSQHAMGSSADSSLNALTCGQCLAHVDSNQQLFYSFPIATNAMKKSTATENRRAAQSPSKRAHDAVVPSRALVSDPTQPVAKGIDSTVFALAQPVTIASTPGLAQSRLLTHVDLYMSPLEMTKATSAFARRRGRTGPKPTLEIFRSRRSDIAHVETVQCAHCANDTMLDKSTTMPSLQTRIAVATLSTANGVDHPGWYRFHVRGVESLKQAGDPGSMHRVSVSEGDSLVLVLRDGSGVRWHAGLKTAANAQAWQRRGSNPGAPWELLQLRYPQNSNIGAANDGHSVAPSFMQITSTERLTVRHDLAARDDPQTQPREVAEWAPSNADAAAQAREEHAIESRDAASESSAAQTTPASLDPSNDEGDDSKTEGAAAARTGRTAGAAQAEEAAKAQQQQQQQRKRNSATIGTTTDAVEASTEPPEEESTPEAEIPSTTEELETTPEPEITESNETPDADTTVVPQQTTSAVVGEVNGEEDEQNVSAAESEQREKQKRFAGSALQAIHALAESQGTAPRSANAVDPLSEAKDRENTDAMIADVVGRMTASDLAGPPDYQPPQGAVSALDGSLANATGSNDPTDNATQSHLPQHILDVADSVRSDVLVTLNRSALPASLDGPLAFPDHVFYLNARAALSYRIVLCGVKD